MARHREKIREVPAIDGSRSPRVPGLKSLDGFSSSAGKNDVDLKCAYCGKVMVCAGWWMGGEIAGWMSDQDVPMECSHDHKYSVSGKWLWRQLYAAHQGGYNTITIPSKFRQFD